MAFRLTSAAPAVRSLLARPCTASSRQFVRRMSKYSSENPHIIKGTNSDVPWIIGAIVFTVPTGFYLLSGNSKPDHHATHASTGHSLISKPHDTQDESPRNISDAASQAAEKASEKAGNIASGVKEKGSEKAQDLNEEKEKTREKVDDLKELKDKGSEMVEDSKEKGSEKAAELKATAAKKAETEENQGKPPSETDKPAAAMKPPKSMNEQSGKQEGISNSETNHAVLNAERGQAISKKSEGTHDTVKLKGTVNPYREAK